MNIKFLFVISFLSLTFCTLGQNVVPNAGFEDWQNEEPMHWATSNLPNGRANAILPTSPGYSGDLAVRGEVIPYPNTPGFPLIPLLIGGYETDGFPVQEAFSKVSLFYRYYPRSAEDALGVFVGVMDAQGNSIGGGFAEVFEEANEYTLLEVPVNYDPSFQPAKAVISISIYNYGESSLPALGTAFEIDEVSLGDLVSPVTDPWKDEVEVSDAYPNPTSGDLNIPIKLFKNQTLRVDLYDLAGRQINSITDHLSQGENIMTVDLKDLPNGLYLCRLSTFGGSMTQKIRISRP